MPSDSGNSGPTMTREILLTITKRSMPWKSSMLSDKFWQPLVVAVPPLPGTQKTCLIRADSSSFFTIACSRPPFPTTKTFTASSPIFFLPKWPLCSVCTYLSAFCSVVNYAMLGARELLDVALFSTGGDYLLFGNGSTSATIEDFPKSRMLRLFFDSILLAGTARRLSLNLPWRAGGFIEIVGSCYIWLVRPPLQDIHCGTFCYKIVRLTQSNLLT